MDYLFVFILGLVLGSLGYSKYMETRKERARRSAKRKKHSEIIMIQGRAYVPKKTKSKVKA